MICSFCLALWRRGIIYPKKYASLRCINSKSLRHKSAARPSTVFPSSFRKSSEACLLSAGRSCSGVKAAKITWSDCQQGNFIGTHTQQTSPLCLSLKATNGIKFCKHSNNHFLDCLSTGGQMLLSLSSLFTFISVPLEESCKCTQTAELALCKSEVVVISTWLVHVTSKRGSWTISALFARSVNFILMHTCIHTYICIMHA